MAKYLFQSKRAKTAYMQDLEYLYETLKSNYPLFNPLYRLHGVDLHELFRNAKNEVEKMKLPFSWFPRRFYAILVNEIFSKVHNFGHLGVMDKRFLQYCIAVFSSPIAVDKGYINAFKPFIKILDNPATRTYYRLTDADFAPQSAAQQTVLQHREGNVEIQVIEEGLIAHVRIHQMSAECMEKDLTELLGFYEKISDYEHLIVDIRGNPGGSNDYFINLVIAPNISEPLNYVQYMFFKAGAHNMRCIEPRRAESLFPEYTPVSKDFFESLPHFHADDKAGLDFYAPIPGEIQPSQEKALFKGKVWLLIDRVNFSASGHAAEIAKETNFAALVGETTSHNGAGGIDPIVLALPNTGIVVKYQAIYGTNHEGRNAYEYGTEPHFPNHDGKDALEIALAIIKNESGG